MPLHAMVSEPTNPANLDGFHSFDEWPTSSPVLLACSGGADSTYLTWAWQLFVQAMPEPPQACAVVVDHGCRSDSREQAEAAKQNLLKMGCETHIVSLTGVREKENDMRLARYEALKNVATQHNAAYLLTAHNADDVAETILLRILRGTGLQGLAGIPKQRPITLEDGRTIELRRPLLHLRSAAIREALTLNQIKWLEDLSNQDSAYAQRNYLRNELMPKLEHLATGDPVEAILRLANEAQDRNQSLEELLQGASDWKSLPSYYRRRVLANKLRELGETVSPARLLDLEGALLNKGTVGVSAEHSLRVSDL